MSIFEKLGVPEVISAAGPLTRLSGARMSDTVLEAMKSAAQSRVRMEDLQARAGEIIARHTGAEAGYATCGAAAAMTLATAACIAGLDVAKMDRLPDTEGMPNQVIVQRAHRNAYDHAIRAAGARLVEVGYLGFPGAGCTHAWQIEEALGPNSVAIACPIMHAPGTVPLPQVTEIAHRHGLPVIVDAAAALPPVENLRRFLAEGADLVAFSGGKAIGGPQASGILAGRADLIESVALQQQDMDVRPDTWSFRRRYLDTGILPGPPHHGLGRSMKAGKEEIAGLLVALEEFVARDHAADRRRWEKMMESLLAALEDLSGLRCRIQPPQETRRPYAMLRVEIDPSLFGRSAVQVVNLLQEGTPRVCVAQGWVDEGAIAVIPTQLAEDDWKVIAERLRALAARC